jgi:hypothetical protein
MFSRGIFSCVLAAGILCGCQKPDYRSYLLYESGGSKHAFAVTVENDVLYIAVSRNGKRLYGSSGNNLFGRKVERVEIGDLNMDGSPELYVFFSHNSTGSRPELLAISCKDTYCHDIAMEGAAGGALPADHCGEDSYRLERDALSRRYRTCSAGRVRAGYRTVKYLLKENSFGLILASGNS